METQVLESTTNDLEITQKEIDRIYKKQRNHQTVMRNTTAQERIGKLKKLLKSVMNNRELIKQAVYNDFRKNPNEVELTEVFPVTSEIKHTISKLGKWMLPHKVPTPLSMVGTSSYLRYEPKGVVLIISPWNYPFNLMMMPLISAIAAGNSVIIKPSEFTTHSTNATRKVISEVFGEEEVAILEGDYHVSTALLKLPFDHIFFTGSTRVGKIVMEAAAKNLSSVTLELGGKSPVIIDKSANIDQAAERIAWGKFINNGQTCIAPDYLYIHSSQKKQFIEAFKTKIEGFYGKSMEDIKKNDSYCRIINNRQFKRLESALNDAVEKGSNVVMGGDLDENDRFIPPTILEKVSPDATLMEEEIFGPILPVLEYDDLDEVIQQINQKDKPLALYIFSKNNKNTDHILKNTSSGGVCINDTIIHITSPYLPFGGVNASGHGSSHGFYGFKAFSHERSVMKQHSSFPAVKLMLPPYTKTVQKLIDLTIKWF